MSVVSPGTIIVFRHLSSRLVMSRAGIDFRGHFQLHFRYQFEKPVLKNCSIETQRGEDVFIRAIAGSRLSVTALLVGNIYQIDIGH